MTSSRFAGCLIAVLAALLVAGDLRAQDQEQRRTSYSLHVGAGGARAWNVVGVSAEYFPAGEHLGLFATAGLGTILAGGGVALYSNRVGNGLFASATAGVAGGHVQAGAQLPLSARTYLTGGVSYGAYFLQHTGFLPVFALEYRL